LRLQADDREFPHVALLLFGGEAVGAPYGALPQTPPRKLFEKSFLGTFKNFEWPKTSVSAELDYNRALVPTNSLMPLSFAIKKEAKEKGGSTEALPLRSRLMQLSFTKRKGRFHRGFASALLFDAAFFCEKESCAKKPLKGIRGGYR
jgi:hypothetical protein